MSLAQLDPEDGKIVTLARSARARVGSAEGAAVRDETGRTYAAATVALPSLQLSALALAVAMAVSSGAVALEAAALVSDDTSPAPADIAAVRDIGSKAIIIYAGSDGHVRQIVRPLSGGCGCTSRLWRPVPADGCANSSRFSGMDARIHPPASTDSLR